LRFSLAVRGSCTWPRISPFAKELAVRRQNPRLSRLLEGRLLQSGSEELLVGNAAAAAVYSRGN
jgi:hypothetical protein